MTQLFGIPIDTMTTILVITTAVIIGGTLLLAITNAIFFKIGVRNIGRRRAQMLLIVFALMLSTTLLTGVLTTGDVIAAAAQSVAIYNLGSVDITITGGGGPLKTFDDYVYKRTLDVKKSDPNIAAVGAALVENSLLLADETSRQVRSNVTALAIIPGSEQGFGGMQDDSTKKPHTIAQLTSNQVYLNHTAAQLLNAHAGDLLYVYSSRWPGKRYALSVRAIVTDSGLVGSTPYILSQYKTFLNIEGYHDAISEVFISLHNNNDVNDTDVSEKVKNELSRALRGGPFHFTSNLQINEVKEQGVQLSQYENDIFTRIFDLFALFALAIGLLLIFLIFVLLAAERRAEMGMARAIGVQRRHLVLMYLFEGTVYDLISSFIGLLVGAGAGILLSVFLGPILARFNFPLKIVLQSRSLLIAYCLGVIFTFFSVGISAWLVSRMTVVDALRNLPETERPTLSLMELCAQAFAILRQVFWARRLRRILFEQLPETMIGFITTLSRLGILPLIAGFMLLRTGLANTQIVPFSVGLSSIAIGVGLLLKAAVDWLLLKAGKRRWKRATQRIFAAVVGLSIMAYWALPFDALARLGLPRFQGGVEVFFVAGSMMVLGAVWALVANADLLLKPLIALFTRLPGLQFMTRLASAYPLHHRFRTGLSIVMFSLVIFAMTVMAVITNAMLNNYSNINYQTGGYDIQAVAYFKGIPDIRAALISHGINPNDFSEIGTQVTTAVGVIQPSAQSPAWRLYPAKVVSGGFLQGYGLHLTARAQGFNSDNAIWQALQTHSNYALIDQTALPYAPNSLPPVYDPNSPSANNAGVPNTPPGFPPYFTYTTSGIYQGETTFSPTPVWVVAGPSFITGVTDQTPNATKLTIIGVVDNSDSAHFGLYISQAAYQYTIDPTQPEVETYYFKVAPGQDKRALSLAIGSAFLDNGVETTVLEDAIWSVRGPRILLSNVLLGVVGLTLLLGIAALAITGTRAVIERRQQIGMLRALGCRRRLIQGAFLSESFFVGCAGSLLGVILGLILSKNIFAVNFFEQFHTGLVFTIPWSELGLIVVIALVASLLAALLPAWQAGRVTPSEALRM
ncbi:MAG TPA: FtsX-like permease family protein [Ktedonobacteraceae bacterium]|nr:FtsX-like permease family protein [Ktedonobacteraceae bacterium]